MKNSVISYSDVSHFVKKLYMQNDYLIVEIKLLNNRSGKFLRGILENRPDSVAFRPKGLMLDDLFCGEYLIIKKYKLIGVHAVWADQAAKL